MKQAVILAGGLGTRLGSILGGRPKALAEISGTPILAYLLDLLSRYHFERALILVGHQAQAIEEYAATWKGQLAVRCIRDRGHFLGTAGSILAAFDELDEEFLVVYGDTMVNVDLNRFSAFHASHGTAAVTLYLHPNNHPHDSDLVEIDEKSRVTAFHPYPHPDGVYFRNLVNAALYCVRKQALAQWRGPNAPLDFGKNVFPAMLAAGTEIVGYVGSEFIKDCGTPQRLEAVRADVKSGRFWRQTASQPQSAVFLDRDGTLNPDEGHITSAERLELFPFAGEAVRKINASGYKAILVTNQPIVAKGLCSPGALQNIHGKLEHLLGQQAAYLDRIYVCPHHPEKGFPGEIQALKIDCECRKPRTGLLKRAFSDLNLSAAESWFVGDSTIDVMTAKNAGLKSILVQTGASGMDYRVAATPDFVMPNVKCAADFIFDDYARLMQKVGGAAASVKPGDLVAVGGLARSGKSTFASLLRRALDQRGIPATILAIDRWFKPSEERGEAIGDKYDIAEVERLIQSIQTLDKPGTFHFPIYDKRHRARAAVVEELVIAPGDVLIVEGSIACGLRQLRPTVCFFITVDESVRMERFFQEYLVRGLPRPEIKELYEARCSLENPAILAHALADNPVTIDLTILTSDH